MARTSPQKCPPTTFALEIPVELQRIIFEEAAKQDVTCAVNLSRVAWYVHDWVQRILYERIVVQSPHAAECLLRTVQSKTLGYFKVMVKSLAFASCVPLPQTRETGPKTVSFLDALNTGSLREVTIVLKVLSNSNVVDGAQLCANFNGDPMAYHYANFFNDPLIALLPTGPRFPNLRSFAVSYGRWTSALPMRIAAPNLQCFAILEPQDMKPERHVDLIKTVQEKEDRRFVVIKNYGDPGFWSVRDCYRPSTFWSMVENLVEGAYISDHGERWDR